MRTPGPVEGPPQSVGGQRGQILLGVLVLVVIVSASVFSFIWFMNQQQTRAGQRYRAAAALYLAEAGVHRALAVLETTTPDGRRPGREWRPRGYEEAVTVGSLAGRFILSIDEGGGVLLVTSVGETGDAVRKIRVQVRLAPPLLLAALYGTGIVKFDAPPAATFLLPYGDVAEHRPWIHVMAGREVWFAASRTWLNDTSVPFAGGPGPVDGGAGGSGSRAGMGPVRIVLAPNGQLTVGNGRVLADLTGLRAFGAPVRDVVYSTWAVPRLALDRSQFLTLALANTANAELNSLAGRYTGDAALERKAHSFYTGAEFVRLLAYFVATRQPPRLRGVIYVRGSVTFAEGMSLRIEDGALITESTVHLSPSTDLTITHSAATRVLPGLVVLDQGALTLAPRARLRVHGLLYVNRAIGVNDGAVLDVVGMVLGNDPGLSFRAPAATVTIRYDPAVLGTLGIAIPDEGPVVAWPVVWEEVP